MKLGGQDKTGGLEPPVCVLAYKNLAGSQAPACSLTVPKHELQRPRSQAGAWERAENHRHLGMDAEIQAKDGNLKIQQMLDSSSILPHRLPSMDAGFRGIHAEMTGF